MERLYLVGAVAVDESEFIESGILAGDVCAT
jgi:hypothetical protein